MIACYGCTAPLGINSIYPWLARLLHVASQSGKCFVNENRYMHFYVWWQVYGGALNVRKKKKKKKVLAFNCSDVVRLLGDREHQNETITSRVHSTKKRTCEGDCRGGKQVVPTRRSGPLGILPTVFWLINGRGSSLNATFQTLPV